MTTATREAVRGRLSLPSDWMSAVRERGVYVALLLLVAYNLFFTPYFASWSTVTTLMSQVPPVLIISLGMAMVIGTGGIDLSVGSTMAIAGAVLGLCLAAPAKGGYATGLTVAILLALAVGLAVGLFNGVMVASLGVQPIVATLAMLVAGRGIALTITSGALVELFNKNLNSLGAGSIGGVPYVMIVALVLAVVVAVLVRRTAFGYRLLAIGGNLRASVLAGIKVRSTLLVVYALSGLLAAISGILLTGQIQSADPSYLGYQLELDAITAVVVGGTALTGGRVKVLGTVTAVVLLQLLVSTLTAHSLPQSTTRVVQAVIIIAAVLIQRTSRTTE